MEKYEHLQFLPLQNELPRKPPSYFGRLKPPIGREKQDYTLETKNKAELIVNKFKESKTKFAGISNPSLIFEIEINQSIGFSIVEKILDSMGIHVLSSAENNKGFWVVFSDDDELRNFKGKLAAYGSEEGPKYDFFHAFGDLHTITRDKKIGARLAKNPLTDKQEYLDIELWSMIDRHRNLQFIDDLKSTYSDKSTFRITDTLITKSFVLLRVKITKEVFDYIIELPEVSRVDRPTSFEIKPQQLDDIDVMGISIHSPDENAAGILIIDSGIVSNHPLLERCVGDERNFQVGEDHAHDTVGHGTAVAGCAAYGNITECIDKKEFIPHNWIYSAKVMFAEKDDLSGQINATYDTDKLVESQILEAVESYLSSDVHNIRVINVSLGNMNEVWQTNYNRQLPLASLIDELAYAYPHVVFIISAGNQHPLNVSNIDSIEKMIDGYPRYLIECSEYKLINPATSALSLTVGSIANPLDPIFDLLQGDNIKVPVAKNEQPSPFTRSGPGINNMIKPELVEYGGNLVVYNNYGRIVEDVSGKLDLLNNVPISKLFKKDYGTSFSAPKVAHLAGQIANSFPQKSAIFIKNMLLLSAHYPFLPDKDFYEMNQNEPLADHLSVTGFGLPLLDRALYSFDNSVVLYDEGKLGLNRIVVYPIHLPDVFFKEKGRKKIIVTLTFRPETRSTRGDSYLGNRMKFHLFHTIDPNYLLSHYGKDFDLSEDGDVPTQLSKFKISMFPGSETRSKGCHQKAWKEYKNEPRKNIPSAPLTLVLLNFNKWINDLNTQVDYCLSVAFEHESAIDLYSPLRASLQIRARVK